MGAAKYKISRTRLRTGAGLKRVLKIAAIALVVLLVAGFVAAAVPYWQARQVREALWAAFEPVRITNCELMRFGNDNDGGYLMCGNLLAAVTSGYSYGINAEDSWGCEIASTLKIPIHQYDCYNPIVPGCPGDPARFHAECVGPERDVRAGKPFDTFARHLEVNGDVGKRLVVKMDVEGSEWLTLAGAPDHVLNAIDQMAVEFHEVESASFLDTARRLREFFYVAHMHQNNYLCQPGFDPFPGQVFEVLLVNKRIAVADPWVSARGPSPLDAPNAPGVPDCQASPNGSEPGRIAAWLQRRWLTWQGKM